MRTPAISLTVATWMLLGSGCGLFVNFNDYENETAGGQGGAAGDASVDTSAGGSAVQGGSGGAAGASGVGGSAGKAANAGSAGSAGASGASGTAGAAGTGGASAACADGQHCESEVDSSAFKNNGAVTQSGLPCTKTSIQVWNADEVTAINSGPKSCSWDCSPLAMCSSTVVCAAAGGANDCVTGATTVVVHSSECVEIGGGTLQYCTATPQPPPGCVATNVTPSPSPPKPRETCTTATSPCKGAPGACISDGANCILSDYTMTQCPVDYGEEYVFYQSMDDHRCDGVATCAQATCKADNQTNGLPLTFSDVACLNSTAHDVTASCTNVNALGSVWLPNSPQCGSGLSSSANGSIVGTQGKKVCCKSPVL